PERHAYNRNNCSPGIDMHQDMPQSIRGGPHHPQLNLNFQRSPHTFYANRPAKSPSPPVFPGMVLPDFSKPPPKVPLRHPGPLPSPPLGIMPPVSPGFLPPEAQAGVHCSMYIPQSDPLCGRQVYHRDRHILEAIEPCHDGGKNAAIQAVINQARKDMGVGSHVTQAMFDEKFAKQAIFDQTKKIQQGPAYQPGFDPGINRFQHAAPNQSTLIPRTNSYRQVFANQATCNQRANNFKQSSSHQLTFDQRTNSYKEGSMNQVTYDPNTHQVTSESRSNNTCEGSANQATFDLRTNNSQQCSTSQATFDIRTNNSQECSPNQGISDPKTTNYNEGHISYPANPQKSSVKVGQALVQGGYNAQAQRLDKHSGSSFNLKYSPYARPGCATQSQTHESVQPGQTMGQNEDIAEEHDDRKHQPNKDLKRDQMSISHRAESTGSFLGGLWIPHDMLNKTKMTAPHPNAKFAYQCQSYSNVYNSNSQKTPTPFQQDSRQYHTGKVIAVAPLKHEEVWTTSEVSNTHKQPCPNIQKEASQIEDKSHHKPGTFHKPVEVRTLSEGKD
ncbi:unnamed protein product, partial [Owenia fusiformis]